MSLDRTLQREILDALAPHYSGLRCTLYDKKAEPEEKNRYVTNMLYLQDHGLIDSGLLQGVDGHWSSGGAKITSAGLDFLAEDGGLTAILGVVTIKLHDETIRDLIAARIQASDLPPAEKTGLLDQLRELRGESIKHLTMKLLDVGMENLPAALPLIQRALGGLL